MIVAYGRSAIARSGQKGSLRNTHPIEYSSEVLTEVLKKVPQLDWQDIDDVIIGCAKPEMQQRQNIGKLITLRTGLPYDVPGQTVNRFCASGLQSISIAANMIMTGQADVVVAGGVESMTAVPFMGIGDPAYQDPWIADHEPGGYISMGLTAENVAERYHVTRADMERFAVDSHMKAAEAQENGKLAEDIIPVHALDDKGSSFLFDKDECVRPNTSTNSLSALKPCFKEYGLVTAGTSSPTNDGAAMAVLMSRKKAEKLALKPLARFLAFSAVGIDPSYMGIGPIKAIPKVLSLTGLKLENMDVIELNEAFAAQALACIKELRLDPKRVNPNGGALALGHPLGATGTILTCKAISELRRIKGRFALVSMCVGGGMGAAAVLEALDPV